MTCELTDHVCRIQLYRSNFLVGRSMGKDKQIRPQIVVTRGRIRDTPQRTVVGCVLRVNYVGQSCRKVRSDFLRLLHVIRTDKED